jgi:MatE
VRRGVPLQLTRRRAREVPVDPPGRAVITARRRPSYASKMQATRAWCQNLPEQASDGVFNPAPIAISGAEIDARTRIILEAPLLRTVIRLAVPNAAVMATQVSLGLIELYFLAKLGVDALAGVSQVFPLVSLVGAISQGAIGGGVLSAVARRLGKTERSKADETVWYAIAIAAASGVITPAVILCGGPAY